jgi:tetratricopeptide (TPR) repeat protein
MKKLITTTIFFIAFMMVFGQDARTYYEKGLEKAQLGQFEEAIKLFSKSIELQPEDYFSWYNRGIAKNRLGLYEESLSDFNQTIKLAPEYKKGYLNRGTTRKHLTDYNGAIIDYTFAINLDPDYADAYYNRGLIFELLNKQDSACIDFNKANELGQKKAQNKIEKCKDTTSNYKDIYPILRLTRTADNDQYGFTPENPIKVGTGPDGGPANHRAYLDLLRDSQGKPIKYNRLGSCCPYNSPNGLLGSAMLDKYEITFLNEIEKEESKIIYISFYDYEEPMIICGFKTVKENYTKSLPDANVLFLIGDRQISKEELQTIDPNDIESIEVIKDKSIVSKYTTDNYDGVIIITMKKDKKQNQ